MPFVMLRTEGDFLELYDPFSAEHPFQIAPILCSATIEAESKPSWQKKTNRAKVA
jgi:hypothetical protein